MLSQCSTTKKTFWASADKLRANIGAAKYKHFVMSFIFAKYISDIFEARCAELRPRLRDMGDGYFYGDFADQHSEAELEGRGEAWERATVVMR